MATRQAARQVGMHTLFTESLPSDGNYMQDWLQQVEAWEENDELRNPYFREVKRTCIHGYIYSREADDEVQMCLRLS